MVVDSDARHVALVAGNDIRLLADRGLQARISSNLVNLYLSGHVVGGGSVEIVVAPFEELVLSENLTYFVVAHGELVL